MEGSAHVEMGKNNRANGGMWRWLKLLLAVCTSLCFQVGYFCFMVAKKTFVNSCQEGQGGGTKQMDANWIVGYHWKKFGF